MRRWPESAFAALVLALVFVSACAPVGPAAQTPALGTPSPAALLGVALKRLQAAESYKLKISARHTWTFEGKPQDWGFEGAGVSAGKSFRSSLQGPAESLLAMKIVDGKLEAWDNRGKIADPTTTSGGPGPGTAPYTAIAYLQKASDVALAPGAPGTWRFTFKPDLAAVAALDRAHAQAMERVRKVAGDAWVSEASGNIEMEKVIIEYIGNSGALETVTMTLEFYDYNKPVSIE